MSKADGVVFSSLLNDILSYDVGKFKTVVLTAQRKKLLNVLVAKSLHGKFFSLLQSPDVNNVKSFQWLHCPLHNNSESSVFAVQDQTNIEY